MCTRTQEKGAVTPQETDLGLSMSVQESSVEAWVDGGLLHGGIDCHSAAWDILKEVAIIFITATCSLASGQTTGKEHSTDHQQKIGLKIY